MSKKDCKICNIVAVILGVFNFSLHIPLILIGLVFSTIVLIIGIVSGIDKLKKYGWNLLISYDQTANSILGGDPDETISSRSGKRQHEQKWAKYLCWFLNKLDTNHCKKSIEENEGNDSTLSD